MRELLDIVQAFEELSAANLPAALATVAAISGSSYRRPGARMLVAGDGRTWGGVSGGCLERDVIRRARMLLDEGAQAIVCCYETGDDGDANLSSDDPTYDRAAGQPGPSLGCGGQIEILIEPISAQNPGPLPALHAAVRRRQAATIVTVIRVNDSGGASQPVRPGQRMVRIGTSEISGTIPDKLLHETMLRRLSDRAPAARGLSRLALSTAGCANVLIEEVRPPQALVIFGDGHDVAPLVELAKSLAWHVTVVGARPVAGLLQRFPRVDEAICADAEDPTAGAIPLPQGAAAMVMAHNLQRDAAVVRALLRQPPAYLGILGPLRRTTRLLASAGAAGFTAPWLFAPVGLDIGAETSEQIALSIVAEIQSFLAGGQGGFLRERPGPIHLRAGESAGDEDSSPKSQGWDACPM